MYLHTHEKEEDTEEKEGRKYTSTTPATPGFHLNCLTWVRSGLAVSKGWRFHPLAQLYMAAGIATYLLSSALRCFWISSGDKVEMFLGISRKSELATGLLN